MTICFVGRETSSSSPSYRRFWVRKGETIWLWLFIIVFVSMAPIHSYFWSVKHSFFFYFSGSQFCIQKLQCFFLCCSSFIKRSRPKVWKIIIINGHNSLNTTVNSFDLIHSILSSPKSSIFGSDFLPFLLLRFFLLLSAWLTPSLMMMIIIIILFHRSIMMMMINDWND